MSGVDNMNYMYSLNANNGELKLYVNFDVKTDPTSIRFWRRYGRARPIQSSPGGPRLRRHGQEVAVFALMIVSLYSPRARTMQRFWRTTPIST